MTTSLTIYGFGLRGNSAYKSIGKHRFRTNKHHKVNKSSQKTMAYLFGSIRSWVQIPSPRPKIRCNRKVTPYFLYSAMVARNHTLIPLISMFFNPCQGLLPHLLSLLICSQIFCNTSFYPYKTIFF